MDDTLEQIALDERLELSFFDKTEEFKDALSEVVRTDKPELPVVTKSIEKANLQQLKNMHQAIETGLPKQEFEVAEEEDRNALLDFLDNEIGKKQRLEILQRNVPSINGL